MRAGVLFLYRLICRVGMAGNGGGAPARSYDRSWAEIEEMLDKAISRREQWKNWFDQCSKDGDRDGMKEAARNHKALDGVIKTLRWTLGEQGIEHPLD
tara:strand:+ start:361 stop:654 length:294 start_codon:yes stop_codon:yes gene_type:complete